MSSVICLDSDDEDQANGNKAPKPNNSVNIQTTMPITITKTTQSNSFATNQALYKSIKNSTSITPVTIQPTSNNNQNPPPLSKIQSLQITNKNQIQSSNTSIIRTTPVTNKNQLKNNQVQITTFKPVNSQLKTPLPANIIQKNMINIKTNLPGITIKPNSTLTSATSKTTKSAPIICSSNSIEVTRVANPAATLTNFHKNANQLKTINSTAPISSGSGITIFPTLKNKSMDGIPRKNSNNNINLKNSSVQGINPKLPSLNQHLQEKLAQLSTFTTTTKSPEKLQENNNVNKKILEFQKIQQENIKKIQKNQKFGKQNSMPVVTNHIANTVIRNVPMKPKTTIDKTQTSLKKNIANLQKNLVPRSAINNSSPVQNLVKPASPISGKKLKIKINSNGIENNVSSNSSGMNKKILTMEQQHKDYLIAQAQMARLNSNKISQINNKNALTNVNKNQHQQQQQQLTTDLSLQNNNNNNNNNTNKKITPIIKNQSPSSGIKRKISESIITSPQPYKRIKPTLVSTVVSPKYNSAATTNSLITIDIEDEDLFIDKPQYPGNSIKSVPPSPRILTPNTPGSTREAFSPHEIIPEKSEMDPKKEKLNDNVSLEPAESKNQKEVDKNEENVRKESKSNGGMKADQVIEKNSITPEYEALLAACKKAESSDEMELLIKKKLLKYYHSVHPDFIKSKNFLKIIKATTLEIEQNPNLVYIKLKNVLEELKTRKNSKLSVMTNEDSLKTTPEVNLEINTGENGLDQNQNDTEKNDKRDRQVKKLSNTLLKIKVIISKLEEEEVDLDNDYNSTYLQVERYKKRACQIYEKICELTGESKHAQREVRKPIIFQGTSYPLINKTIQTFVNRTKSFPDYQDILRLLEYCNSKNNMDLSSTEMGMIARDAFDKVGTLLQKRRKTELYETVTHWAGDKKDPAAEDPILSAKLNENHKTCKKISEVINKYAKRQSGIIVSSDSEEQSDNDIAPKSKKIRPLADSDEEDVTSKEIEIDSDGKTNSKNEQTSSSNSAKDEKINSLSNSSHPEKSENKVEDSKPTEESKANNRRRTSSPQPGPSGINAKLLLNSSRLIPTNTTPSTTNNIKSLNLNLDVNSNNQNIKEKTKSRRNNNNANHKVVCEIILSDDDESQDI